MRKQKTLREVIDLQTAIRRVLHWLVIDGVVTVEQINEAQSHLDQFEDKIRDLMAQRDER